MTMAKSRRYQNLYDRLIRVSPIVDGPLELGYDRMSKEVVPSFLFRVFADSLPAVQM